MADRSRRALRAVCLTTGAVIAALAGAEGIAAGQEPPESAGCPVVASAQAMTLTGQKAGDLALGQPAGAEVPAAQVCLNVAVAESTAFASAAYPGATVVTAPGGAADFPGYVSSSHPDSGEAKYDQGAVVLEARSTETSSTATARTGPPSVGTSAGTARAEAKGSVDPAAGTAVASATAETTPASLDEVLTLGKVRSRAEARLRPDGTIERASSLEIGRTTVAGQVVTITEEGVQAAGQTVAVPGSAELGDLLAEAGIQISYLRARQTETGVLSPGVAIRIESKDSAGTATVLSYVVGRSFAAVTTPDDAAAEQPTADPGALGGAVPSGDPATPAGPSIVSSGSAPLSPGEVVAVGPDATSPEDAEPQVAMEPRRLVAGAGGAAFGAFYAVLVLGGLVLLASSTSLRLWGVRTRWIS